STIRLRIAAIGLRFFKVVLRRFACSMSVSSSFADKAFKSIAIQNAPDNGGCAWSVACAMIIHCDRRYFHAQPGGTRRAAVFPGIVESQRASLVSRVVLSRFSASAALRARY